MIVVALGNAFDGLALYGPFEDSEDAAIWAENNTQGNSDIADWNIVNVEPREALD